MKKRVFLLTLIMVILLSSMVTSAPVKPEKITVDRKPIYVNTNPRNKRDLHYMKGFVYEGITYMPIRDMSSVMNKDIAWSDEDGVIYIRDNDKPLKDLERKLYDLTVEYLLAKDYKAAKEFLQLSIDLDLSWYERSWDPEEMMKIIYGGEKPWTVKETKNLVFYFPPNSSIKDFDKHVKEKQEFFDKINSILKVKLHKKIDVFEFNEDKDVLGLLDYELAFARPETVAVYEEQGDFLSGHEIAHVIIMNTDGFINRVDLINEGAAVYFDQTGRNHLTQAKRQIKNSNIKAISIKKLWLNWPGERTGSFNTYPLAGAFVEHLIDQEGMDKFKELLKDQSYENAKVIYGDKIDDIIADFEKKLY